MSLVIDDAFRCPTCRAAQQPSETCRRCKCDLSLVRETRIAYRGHRASCLSALGSSDLVAALNHSRHCVHLDPCPDALKLWSVCCLLAGDWPLALAANRQVPEDS